MTSKPNPYLEEMRQHFKGDALKLAADYVLLTRKLTSINLQNARDIHRVTERGEAAFEVLSKESSYRYTWETYETFREFRSEVYRLQLLLDGFRGFSSNPRG